MSKGLQLMLAEIWNHLDSAAIPAPSHRNRTMTDWSARIERAKAMLADAQNAASDSEITQLRERVAAWEQLHALQSALLSRSDDDAEIARLRKETEELRIQNWPLRAKVEALRAELSGSQNDVAELLTTVEQQRQYIESLKSQVGELLAWKRAVPVTPIERYICDGYGDDDATSDGDWKTILAWLDGMTAVEEMERTV